MRVGKRKRERRAPLVRDTFMVHPGNNRQVVSEEKDVSRNRRRREAI
jgi:hypothetical protein